jgi:hypothetical protein
LSITSDQAVADAIRRVFDKFDEVGTARQVLARGNPDSWRPLAD